MKKIYMKTISLLFVFLFLLFTPVGSFLQGENAKVYAIPSIENEMANFLFPIVAYVASQQLAFNGAYDTAEATVADVKKIIDELKTQTSAIANTLNIQSKVLLAKLYTTLDDFEINKMLGTTYTTNEMAEIQQQADELKLKIQNNQTLINKDLKILGVHDILARYFKSQYSESSNAGLKENTSSLGTVTYDSILYVELTEGSYSVRSTNNYFDNSDFIRFINGKYNYSYKSGGTYGISNKIPYTIPNQLSTLSLSNEYYLKCVPNGIAFMGGTNSPNIIYLTKSYIKYGWKFFVLKKSDDSVQSYIQTSDYTSANVTKAILDMIKPYCLSNIINSDYYINSTNYNYVDLFNLLHLGTVTYTTPDVILGQNSISALTAKVIDYTGSPDTSQTQAERVIQNKATDGTVYDNNITAETNQNGDEDIVITPPQVDGIPSTSTADTNIDAPTDAVGEGIDSDGKSWIFNIPILSDIFSFLKSLITSLKAMFLSLFIPSPTFFTEYFNRVQIFVGDKLGIFGFPLEILFLFVNSYLDIPDDGDVVIHVPALNVKLLNNTFTFFPDTNFDFNTIFNLSGFGNLRIIYLLVVDCIVIFGLIYLLYKKGNEVLRN